MSERKESPVLRISTTLTLVFTILKLTHTIDLSWWWVTVPLWGGFAILLVVLALVILLKTLW